MARSGERTRSTLRSNDPRRPGERPGVHPIRGAPGSQSLGEQRRNAVSGTKVSGRTAIRHRIKCAFCGGTGRDPFGVLSKLSKCQVCGGEGTLSVEEPSVECAYCGGRGAERDARLTCQVCRGKGVATVPPGAVECPLCSGKGRIQGHDLPCTACGGVGSIGPERAQRFADGDASRSRSTRSRVRKRRRRKR